MKFGLLFVLITGLIAGCSNSGSSSAEVPTKDFGVLNLTYDVPSKQDLGKGKACVITAKQLNPGTCELIVSIDKSGKPIESRRQIPAMLDKPTEFVFESAHVSFTPHIQ
ncbi:MAG: hypothetical protein JWO95_3634 [Verrucomicrobiales bacterium]|nr:hypothetical protein [Verrucomicrobiales bacterium]